MRPSDSAAWQGLWDAYLEFYGSSVAQEVTTTTFRRLTDPEYTDQACFVALADGVIVGFTHYLFHAHNWKIENVCYLQDLYVREDARGQGVARALIEAVYEAADRNGTPTVYWMTQSFNEGARALYDRIATLTPFIKYQRA